MVLWVAGFAGGGTPGHLLMDGGAFRKKNGKITTKFKIFRIKKKNVLWYVKQLGRVNYSAKFQIDTSIFDRQKLNFFLQHYVYLMVTSYNKTRFLGLLAHLEKNKWHHWIPGDILHQKQVFVFQNKNVKIWPFLSWPYLFIYLFNLIRPFHSLRAILWSKKHTYSRWHIYNDQAWNIYIVTHIVTYIHTYIHTGLRHRHLPLSMAYIESSSNCIVTITASFDWV